MEKKHIENEEGMRIVRRTRVEEGRRMYRGTLVWLAIVVVGIVAILVAPGEIEGLKEHPWRIVLYVAILGGAVVNVVNVRRMMKGKKSL